MEYDPVLLQRINDVMSAHIRPSLKMDGGDISVVSLEGNLLFVQMHGACSRCPHVLETLKFGVEKTLRQMVSPSLEVREVRVT